jgi:glycosyltransferase involved in cell wall biosynthesis
VDLTVVILTYNSAATIEACLASVAAQHHRPAEILIVDDDSEDSTLALVDAFARTAGLPVRVIRNGSHNISRGRNLGMAAAAGPIVAFLDSDAHAEPGWTGGLASAFVAEPDVAVVGGEVLADHASDFAAAVAVNDGAIRRLATSGTLLISGCNMAVHPERAGGALFDERWVHAEDIEYVGRVGRWTVAPAARVWHESRPTVRGYFRQMYRYGMWKVRYTIRTRHVRLVDFSPSAAMLASAAAAVISPWFLLAYPALSVAETLAVAAYARPPARLLPLMLAGWLVKNTGWGLGVLTALLQQVTGRSGIPAGEPVRVA